MGNHPQVVLLYRYTKRLLPTPLIPRNIPYITRLAASPVFVFFALVAVEAEEAAAPSLPDGCVTWFGLSGFG